MKKTRKNFKNEDLKIYPISVRLNKYVYSRLEAFSKFNGISKSKIILIALERYLNEEEKK